MLMPNPQTRLSHSPSSKVSDVELTQPVAQAVCNMSQHSAQQQYHIKKLLTTAATATGIVGDVDALLTPIETRLPIREGRPERNLWRTDEIMQMLTIMQWLNAVELLNDKTVKSEKVFRDVEEIMHKKGYRKKSHVQIWTKWKFLKSTYTTSKRNGTTPKMIATEIYEMLHKMLGRGGQNEGATSTTTTTRASVEGDNSDVSGMATAGMDSGCNGTAEGPSQRASREEEAAFDMAHPIFGFRLGLVKPEPVDTGYETVENSVNGPGNDPLEESSVIVANGTSAVTEKAFLVEVKQEVEEPPTSPALVEPIVSAESSMSQAPKENCSSEIVTSNRLVRVTPKTTVVSAADSVNSVATSTTAAAATNIQLPPLRIAPFAKELSSPNTTTISRAAGPSQPQPQLQPQPPPPPPAPYLNQPPTTRSMRIANMSNGSLKQKATTTFSQPRLMAQPILPPAPIRLPKEITIQSRAAVSSPNLPKLKQVPMRKTPYSLRPERTIPDLDSSTSPPALDVAMSTYHEVPSTSQLVMQSSNSTLSPQPVAAPANKKRKRRLDIRWNEPTTPKVPKYQRNVLHVAKHQGDAADGDREAKTHEHLLEKTLIELSSSLRDMQIELMREFFAKQKELVRKDHEFQMKQDAMIMQAFQQQTCQIMKSVRQLMHADSTEEARTSGKASELDSENPQNEEQEGKHQRLETHETGRDERIRNGEEEVGKRTPQPVGGGLQKQNEIFDGHLDGGEESGDHHQEPTHPSDAGEGEANERDERLDLGSSELVKGND